MDQSGWEAIQGNWLFLLGELETDRVVHYLFQERVLDEHDLDKVKAVSTKMEKAEVLLVTLKTRPDSFERLCECLKKTQSHITEKLLKTKVDLEREFQMIAAIDLGTTYSSWAYSFHEDYIKDPMHINTMHPEKGNYMSEKIPTCLLIQPDGKTPHAFGLEAENKYAELAATNQHKQWFYFKKFKMMLYSNTSLKRHSNLEDENGNPLLAMEVFKQTIQWLRNDLLSKSKEEMTKRGVEDRDIQWYITVPAIWDEPAKQFMKEAAIGAGIAENHFHLALEPEAAALYCKHLKVRRQSTHATLKTEFMSFEPGARFMVLDAGGGTVDLTVHMVTRDGTLKEIHKACGNAWGGTKVDEAYRQLIIRLFGGPVVMQFQELSMEDYLQTLREFEVAKRNVAQRNTNIKLSIPVSLKKTFTEKTGEKIDDAIAQTQYEGKIKCKGDSMRVDVDIIRGLFDDANDGILSLMSDVIKDVSLTDVIMVGGFSESDYLRERIKAEFPKLNIIVPPDASLAVLKGAVIYGHRPTVITERVSKHYYSLQPNMGGTCRQKLQMGQSIPASDVLEMPQGPSESKKGRCCRIYVSDNPSGQGSFYGEFRVTDPNMRICLNFGETSLKAEGRDNKTWKTKQMDIDFLS